MTDWNDEIIAEFRENGGKVGGPFEGAPMLLLHTVGARSGQERVSPMVYRTVDGGIAVFASKGGADTNPAWFHNLVANPDTTVQVGLEVRPVRARVAGGEERERLWAGFVALYPGSEAYRRNAKGRTIPVVVLERRQPIATS